ncbi:MAG: hypothetical protein RL264_2978 [Bacteroidota bacterium]|jgi:hypothetical protein
MKRILLGISLVISSLSFGQFQIGNSNLEQWDNVGQSTEEPTNWNSFKTGTGSLSSFGSKQVERSTSIRAGATGSYCARIWSVSTLGQVANGNMTLGQINMGSSTPASSSNYNFSKRTDVNFSEAMTDKPDSIVFWVKFTPASGSPNARMHAILHGNYDFRDPIDAASQPFTVARAELNYPKTNGAWVRKSVPFVYEGPATSVTHLLVSFSTNQTPGGGAANDEVLIDDVQLIYVPKASFTTSSVSICEGESITFTNTSTNYPTSYSWTFGGGTPATSTSTSPTITFNTAGTYTVALTATNSFGSNTMTQTSLITVKPKPTVTTNGNQTVCSGTSATVTATGAASYSWSPGNQTSPSIIATPTSTTTYTVTGLAANGCSNTATATISVISFPAPQITPSTTAAICENETVILTSSDASSFLWSTGETTQSISVSPSQTTTYTITAIGSNGCSSSTPYEVLVNAINLVVTSPVTSVCEGASTTVTASGANSYLWNNGETTATITVSPTVATTYTVTATSGSCSEVGSYFIGVGQIIVFGDFEDSTICEGSSIVLSVSGADNYTWSNGDVGSSITVSPSVATIYTVTGITGSCTGTTNFFIDIQAPISVSVLPTSTTVCSGANVTLTASGATSYLWSNGQTGASITVPVQNTTVFTVSGQTASCFDEAVASVSVFTVPTLSITSDAVCFGGISPLSATPEGGTFSGVHVVGSNFDASELPLGNSYPVTYTFIDVNNCTYSTTENVVTEICESVDELEKAWFTIYPNPTSEMLHFNGLTTASDYSIFSINGGVLMTGTTSEVINVASLQAGYYWITVKENGKSATAKFIKW